jgi:hypothetical protein
MSKPKTDNFRYSIIPARAITDQNITAQALRVLALLGRHGDDNGWCRRSQVRMAKELACSRGTIQNALDLLVGPENGKGYVEKREETRTGEIVEGRQPHCAYSYKVRLDLDDAGKVERANRLAPPVPADKQGVPSQEKHGVPIPVAPLTEHSPSNIPLANSDAPVGADESGKVASLGQGSAERWPEFRSTVANTWPSGFPADNELACRTAFERQTRTHPPELIIACAGLHGAAKQKLKESRHKGAGSMLMKLPSNWLRDGDWQGYIPAAEAAVIEEARITTALGNVRRALGDGLFKLMREKGMHDAAIAMLDGMTLADKAHFTITSGFQRTLLERLGSTLERHLGDRPTYTQVDGRRAG